MKTDCIQIRDHLRNAKMKNRLTSGRISLSKGSGEQGRRNAHLNQRYYLALERGTQSNRHVRLKAELPHLSTERIDKLIRVSDQDVSLETLPESFLDILN